MKQDVLTIEQMKHLQDLGLDTSDASMCYDQENNLHLSVNLFTSFHKIIPAYTLTDILNKLPESFPYWDDDYEYRFSMRRMNDNKYWLEYSVWTHSEYEEYGYVCRSTIHSTCGHVLEAAYKMLVWCLENKHIKTNII